MLQNYLKHIRKSAEFEKHTAPRNGMIYTRVRNQAHEIFLQVYNPRIKTANKNSAL